MLSKLHSNVILPNLKKDPTTCFASTSTTSKPTTLPSSNNYTVRFGLYATNFTQFMSLISTQTGNINGCLQNCSSSGICLLSNGILACQCFQYFTGTSCQYDTRPCASNPCLNNGTCLNNLTASYYFKCECQNTFYGVNCEKQINVCENKTCNDHGYCFNDQNMGKCKCFTSYTGENCEKESLFVILVKTAQWLTTIICIVCMVVFCVIIVGNDVLSFLKLGIKRIDINEWRREKLHGIKSKKNPKKKTNQKPKQKKTNEKMRRII